MAARHPTSRSRSNTASSSTVRRNLFNQPQSRRPAANTTSEALQLQDDSNDDILIRDSDGRCQMRRPAGPEDDEEEIMQAALEKDNQRFIESYRSTARQNIDPTELRSAVQASLLAKVASLDDDKWMYEREDDVDPQA